MSIQIKDNAAIKAMQDAGFNLSEIFVMIGQCVKAGVSTLELDSLIDCELKERNMISGSKGYKGYRHCSCISLNDEVVHGIPSARRQLVSGDLVKVDVSASLKGYYADMARTFFVEPVSEDMRNFVSTVQNALDKGIEQAYIGNRLSDISAAIQSVIEAANYSVVRDFAGHGIGKAMHEDPEILNFGTPGRGPLLKSGMALAIEPMACMKNYKVYIDSDGWTVKSLDGSLAAHIEDTIIVTGIGPLIVTRPHG